MAGSVILVIVESPEQRVLFNQHLRDTPHRLIFSLDGADGFDRFREVKPDLVITHLNAHRLDGAILCQLIRQEPAGSTVPVIVMAEDLSGDSRAAERCAAIGADDFLPVPWNRELLLAKLGVLLAGFSGESHTARAPSVPPARVSSPVISSHRGGSTDGEITAGETTGGETTGGDVSAGETSAGETSAGEISAGDITASDRRARLLRQGDGEVTLHDRGITGRIELPSAEAFIVGPIEGADDDMPTSLNLVPADIDTGDMLQPIVLQPSSSAIQTLNMPVVMPESVSSLERLARSGGLTEPLTPIERPNADSLIEEPMLPVGAMGSVQDRYDDDETRVEPDRLIAEVSREITPSAERARGNAGDRADPQARMRRGLDESQLGRRLIRRVQQVHGMLEQLDHYQLLGIEPEASPEQIRAAYFDLSLEFHPDRFFLLRSGEVKEKIYAVFRRVTEAYSVLADPLQRVEYDQRMGFRKKRAVLELVAPPIPQPHATVDPALARASKGLGLDIHPESKEARRFVNLAESAVRTEELDDARLFLTLALAYEPDSSAIRRAMDEVSHRRVAQKRAP
ncbi:MAG: DnaJ domain-containing protein [Deltaproteobacteria bacterium]|nr:DnaJ domain-containing protein [Deltaproteobacteria bacterium]